MKGIMCKNAALCRANKNPRQAARPRLGHASSHASVAQTFSAQPRPTQLANRNPWPRKQRQPRPRKQQPSAVQATPLPSDAPRPRLGRALAA